MNIIKMDNKNKWMSEGAWFLLFSIYFHKILYHSIFPYNNRVLTRILINIPIKNLTIDDWIFIISLSLFSFFFLCAISVFFIIMLNLIIGGIGYHSSYRKAKEIGKLDEVKIYLILLMIFTWTGLGYPILVPLTLPGVIITLILLRKKLRRLEEEVKKKKKRKTGNKSKTKRSSRKKKDNSD